MTADRELDARIAEEVMGWEKMCLSYRPETKEYTHWKIDTDDGLYHIQASIPEWSPSTQIADAWLVVEKLGKLTGKDVLVEHCADGERLCTLGWHYRGIWMKDIQEKADTAPLAICLAALEAVK